MESEDSTRFADSLGQGPAASGLDVSKDLAIPSELEEPINLSVKKNTAGPSGQHIHGSAAVPEPKRV